MKNLFLIGFMGCGKSTVAACLNKEYGMDVVEMDEMISKRQGMSIPDIFETYGETYFRDLESDLIEEIQTLEGRVVSCGGGAVLREKNVAKMKEGGQVVLLTAKPETILERVKEDDNRPVLKGKKTVEGIRTLMEGRRERYLAAADIVISTDGKSPEEICREIIGKC